MTSNKTTKLNFKKRTILKLTPDQQKHINGRGLNTSAGIADPDGGGGGGAETTTHETRKL